MKLTLTPDQVRFLRLKAQRLLPEAGQPARSPTNLLRSICGVQAQELPAARLAIRARSQDLTAAIVDQERQGQRSTLWTWCMRGTLHLVAAEDARWLIPLLGPGMIAAQQRRLQQLGWDEARLALGQRLVKEALSERGSLTRLEIGRLLEANSLPGQGQAPAHLLYRMTMEGLVCRGPDCQGEPTYVLFEAWAGKLQPLLRPAGLARLARRYLEAYGPAGVEDLAAWSGLKLSELRQAWRSIADELLEVEISGKPGGYLKAHRADLEQQPPAGPIVRLLPRYDTYLLGYARRDLAVDPAYARRIHPGGGIIHPVLLVNGQAHGTWKTEPRKHRLEIRVAPFETIPSDVWNQIEAEVVDLGRFLDEATVLVRQQV